MIFLGALLLWLLEPNGVFTFPMAIYTSASCVSQSGLAVVDWSRQSTSTYVIRWGALLSLLHLSLKGFQRFSPCFMLFHDFHHS